MRKIKVKTTTEIKVKGILAFFIKRVTPFGTGAKIDCPKEYLGKKVYVIVVKD